MGALQMIRTITLIAFMFFLAFPKFALAQIEMCTAWYPQGPSRLAIRSHLFGSPNTVAPPHFYFGLDSSSIGIIYASEHKPFLTPQDALDFGLYYEHITSNEMINIFGQDRRCGAKINLVPCFSGGVESSTYFGIESVIIPGCTFEQLGSPTAGNTLYQSYQTMIIDQSRTCSGVTKLNYDQLLSKSSTPKQVTPVLMDQFSMGWFWTDNDDNDLASNWRSTGGKTPMEVAFSDFVSQSTRRFCYDYSQWSIENIGAIDFDDSSTIIDGKKWREFFVEVVMQQHTCYDCGVGYADNLWTKPSPAGTTGGGGGGGTGGNTGGQTGGDGETSQTVCVEGDTRAACSTIDAPPSGDNAVIPEYYWTFNDPQGQPSFASPWTLSGSAECPANVSFSVSGYGLNDLDFTQLCGLISGPMRAVLLFISSLTALAIAIPRP